MVATRAWLGTPYRHQASVRGVGADCLGLVRGVWREVVGDEPEAVPAYTPDWAEVGGAETLLAAAGRWLPRLSEDDEWRMGDVLVFRMSPGVPAKHCAILSGVPDTSASGGCAASRGGRGRPLRHPAAGGECRMIHAYWGRAVVESWMGPWWRSKVAGAFRFPSVEV